MNILIGSRAVAPLHGWGGLERATADLCNGLAARGHAVTLITTEPSNTSSDDPALSVVALITVPWHGLPGRLHGTAPDRAIAYPRAVRAATRRVSAGAAHYDGAIGMGAMAAAFIPLRERDRVRTLILNPQGMEEFYGKLAKRLVLRPQQRLVRYAARRADTIIATDDYLVDAVYRTLRVPHSRITVIPNGVDVAAIDGLTSGLDAESPGPLSLVSVARIVPYKGLTILAEALGRIRDRLPAGWRWTHIGDGPHRAAVESAIERAGIRNHASLLGHIPNADLHQTLARSTLFVHPTLYEGSSLVTLEAMTHGLPVIASAAGGIPDKVVPGMTGWLVPPGNTTALADALLAAGSLSAEQLHTMGMAGRDRVVARFSLARTLDLTETLLSG
jgi:glycogen(starch) synthase